jgi:hypothetical protein
MGGSKMKNMKTDKEKLVELMQLTATLIDSLEDFGSESADEYRDQVDQIIED